MQNYKSSCAFFQHIFLHIVSPIIKAYCRSIANNSSSLATSDSASAISKFNK